MMDNILSAHVNYQEFMPSNEAKTNIKMQTTSVESGF